MNNKQDSLSSQIFWNCLNIAFFGLWYFLFTVSAPLAIALVWIGCMCASVWYIDKLIYGQFYVFPPPLIYTISYDVVCILLNIGAILVLASTPYLFSTLLLIFTTVLSISYRYNCYTKGWK